MSIICDPSGEWSISQEDIFKINRKVAGMLAEKIEKNSKINLGKFINSIFDEVVKLTGDQQRALAVARHIPFAIELSKQVYSDKIRVPLHKNKLLDSAALEDVTVLFTESLDNVAKFLNDYRDSLKPKVINTTEVTNASAAIQPKSTVDVSTIAFVPDNVLTTSGNEVRENQDLVWYYNFLKHLGENNIYPNADGTIDYFGNTLQVTMMTGKKLPVNKLYPLDRQQDNIAAKIAKLIYIAFTDTDGNFVFFDENYNITDGSGSVIYFPLRGVPKVLSVENGKRIFDIDQSVKEKKIQPISAIVANRRKAGENVDESLVRDQINQNYNDIQDLIDYLTSPGNFMKTVKLDLNYISRGFIYRTAEKKPVDQIANLSDFNPEIFESLEMKGDIQAGFYVFGVEEPIPFTMGDFPKELAEKTADLLLNEVTAEGIVLTPSKKAKIISRYIGFNLNDKTGPEGSTGFYYDPATGTILLNSQPISSDKETAKQEIVDFLTREIAKVQDGKSITFKNKLYFNKHMKGDNFIEFELIKRGDGFEMLMDQIPYEDWVRSNAFTQVMTVKDEVRELNGYIAFEVPIESLVIARAKMTTEQIKEFKKQQEAKKQSADQTLKGNAPTDTSADDLANLLTRRDMTGFEITATPEQVSKAKEDYDNKVITFRDRTGKIVSKKLSDLIPYQTMFDIANSNGDIRATWTRAGIILFQGSDYSDLYHESWHAFTQWFLTGDQKLKLYNEVKQSGETISYYKNGWKTMKSSDLDFNNPEHILYAEEHLAEKFREYSLGKYTPKTAVQKSIFKRIWDAVKALFGFGSPEEVLAPSGVVAKAFQDLKAGNLVDYTFDQSNIQFNRLNSGITALVGSTNPIKSLDITSSLEVTDAVTDVISSSIDELNKQTGTNKFTLGVFENETVKKAVLTRAKSKLIDKYNELNAKLDLVTGFEKDRLTKAIATLEWTIENFDVEKPKEGVLKYYNDRTEFFNLTTGSKVIDQDTSIEGQSEQNAEEAASREGITTDEGTEFSATDRMSDSMRYVLSSLFERVEPTKNNPEGYVYNSLGFRKTVPLNTVFKVVASATADKLTIDDMYRGIQTASNTKTKSKKTAYKFLFLKQLLEKIGDPSNTSTQSFTGQKALGDLFFTFRLDRQEATQVTIETSGANVILKVGTSDSANKAFGRALENQFQLGKIKSKFISKNKNNENVIDLKKILEEYPTVGDAKARAIKFLNDLGIDITDTDAVNDYLVKKNIISNLYKVVLDKSKLPVEIVSISSDKKGGLFENYANLWNQLLDAESKYSGFNAGYMVKNVNGDPQSEMNNPSTAGNLIHLINQARTYAELISDPRAAHYSTERNPFVKTSVIFKKLFGRNLTFKNTDNGKPVEITVQSLLGTQALAVEEEIRILLNGMKSAASDEQTAYLRDYFMTMLNGASEAFRHADKTSAYIVGLDTGKVFHYINPEVFKTTEGRRQANEILVGYVAAEFERIKKVKQKQVLGEQANDLILFGKPGNYTTYEKTGSDFTVFDDILKKDLQEELKNLSGSTVEEFMTAIEADNNALKDRIVSDLNNYFEDLALEDYKELSSFGVTKAQGFFDSIRSRFSGLANLTQDSLFKTTSEAFTYNSFIHKFEMSTLVYGDAALFQHDKEEHMKRISGFFATGRIGRTDSSMNAFIERNPGSYHKSQWFNQSGLQAPVNAMSAQSNILPVAVLEDNFDRSVYLDEMLKAAKAANVAESDYEAYEAMKTADAEAWITFDAYRALELRFNNWSPYKEELYQKILRNETMDDAEVLKTFFPIKKLQYSGPLKLENFAANAFHKYSLIPLIPTLVKGTRLEALHNKLVSQGLAYGVTHSGSKVTSVGKNGSLDGFYTKDYEPKFTADDYVFTKNFIFVDYLKEQLVTKDKFKDEIDFPTQIRKLITTGLAEDHPLVKAYISNIDAMVKVATNELRMELGYKDIKSRRKGEPAINLQKLLEYVKDSLTVQDLSEQAIDFIKIGDDGKPVYTLDLSEDPQKIEKIISSLVNKRVNKQPVYGEQYIQASSVGFEKFSKPTDLDIANYGNWGLPFYSMNKDGKTVNAMKIKIALHGKFKNLLKLKDNDGNVIGTIEKLNQMLKNEKWLNTGEHRQMITLIGARIPTQGPNSMEFMEVYEFLPEAAGNIMILPLEIVAKSGGDFDIDKLVTMLPGITDNEGIIEIEKPKSTRKLLNTILERKAEILDEIKEIRKKYIKSYLKPEFQEQIDIYEQEQRDAYKDFLAQWTNNYYIGGATEKYYARINAAKFEIDRIYAQLDQDILETKKGEFDQYISEITPLKEELRILNREENWYRPKAYQQNVLNSMRGLLSRADNYINLTRPNGTNTYTVDEYEDLGGTLVEAMGRVNRSYSKKKNKTNPLEGKKMSPTRIMENKYNTNKAAALFTGKMSVGMLATGNTFHPLAAQSGVYMSPFRVETKIKKTGPVDYVLPQRLLVSHNTKTVDGQTVIDFAQQKDANGDKYIRDIISELMNGYLDVAKEDWIYDINAIKQLEPEFEFMMLAGVPVKTAALMLAQPLVREYLNLFRKLASPYSVFDPTVQLQNVNFAKREALMTVLLNNGMEDAFPLDKNGDPNTYVSTPELLVNLGENYLDEDSKFTDKELIDNLRSSDSNLSRQQFAHFAEIIYMASQVTNLKMAIRFDTLKNTSYFDAEQQEQNFRAVLGTAFPASVVRDLISKTVLNSFRTGDLLKDVIGSLLPLRGNPAVNSKIAQIISKSSDLTVDDKERLANQFNTDLVLYFFQNKLYSFDSETDTYRSETIQGAETSIQKEQVLKFGAFLNPETGVMHVDKGQIIKDFRSKAFSKDRYGGEVELAKLPSNIFDRYSTANRVKMYYKYVLEREFLRNQFPFNEAEQSFEFANYLVMVGTNENTPRRYEEFLRNKALENLFIDGALFASEYKMNGIFTATDKFKRILESNPELMVDFPVLNIISTVKSGSMSFFKLNDKVSDGTILTAYKDQMRNLADPGVTKVANPEENLYISDFFKKLNTIGYLQAGSNKNSEMYMMSILDMTPIASYVQDDILNTLNNSDKLDAVLEDFGNKFESNFSTRYKLRYTNYASNSIGTGTSITSESQEKPYSQKGKVKSGSIFINEDTSEIEDVFVYKEDLFETRENIETKQGDILQKRIYRITNNDVKALFNLYPEATFIFEDVFPKATLNEDGTITVREQPKTPTNIEQQAFRAGLDTNNSFAIPVSKADGTIPLPEKSAVARDIIDNYINQLVNLKNSGKILIFPSEGIGNRLLGFYKDNLGNTVIRKESAKNTDLFLYLSKKLLENFGYRNPKMELITKNFSVELLEGSETGLEYIQNFYIQTSERLGLEDQPLQSLTDKDVNDYINKCKGIS